MQRRLRYYFYFLRVAHQDDDFIQNTEKSIENKKENHYVSRFSIQTFLISTYPNEIIEREREKTDIFSLLYFLLFFFLFDFMIQPILMLLVMVYIPQLYVTFYLLCANRLKTFS